MVRQVAVLLRVLVALIIVVFCASVALAQLPTPVKTNIISLPTSFGLITCGGYVNGSIYMASRAPPVTYSLVSVNPDGSINNATYVLSDYQGIGAVHSCYADDTATYLYLGTSASRLLRIPLKDTSASVRRLDFPEEQPVTSLVGSTQERVLYVTLIPYNVYLIDLNTFTITSGYHQNDNPDVTIGLLAYDPKYDRLLVSYNDGTALSLESLDGPTMQPVKSVTLQTQTSVSARFYYFDDTTNTVVIGVPYNGTYVINRNTFEISGSLALSPNTSLLVMPKAGPTDHIFALFNADSKANVPERLQRLSYPNLTMQAEVILPSEERYAGYPFQMIDIPGVPIGLMDSLLKRVRIFNSTNLSQIGQTYTIPAGSGVPDYYSLLIGSGQFTGIIYTAGNSHIESIRLSDVTILKKQSITGYCYNIVSDGTFIYAHDASSVYKIDMFTFTVAAHTQANIGLVNWIARDRNTGYIYLAGLTVVAQVDPSTLTVLRTIPTQQNQIAWMDIYNGFLIVCDCPQSSEPSRLVKIDLRTFSVTTLLQSADKCWNTGSFIDSKVGAAYFVSTFTSSVMLKVDIASFTISSNITLGGGGAPAAAVDVVNRQAWLGLNTAEVQILTVCLDSDLDVVRTTTTPFSLALGPFFNSQLDTTTETLYFLSSFAFLMKFDVSSVDPMCSHSSSDSAPRMLPSYPLLL
eukprot:TRINITY_DN646_c0_g1_i1.p1 TRINITY_DN646_c0_g1~~TRINITY_DN646_c0_g1_i1.p1  ORF type:complete len:690 (+),score=73.11 TRINITY_DN646_c0_g1_i1:71-2140(+)